MRDDVQLHLNSVELNRESELYLVFEAESVPDQLEFFPATVLASWVESLSYRSFVSYCSTIWDLLVNHFRIGNCHYRSISCSTIWDLLVNHLRIGACHYRSISFSFYSQHAPMRPEIFVALTFHS